MNVVRIDCTVGRVNIIDTVQGLDNLFNHLNVTLFRTDKTGFEQLWLHLRSHWIQGHIEVHVGVPKANRWIQVICRFCGCFAYVAYAMAGDSVLPTAKEHEARRLLLQFSKCPFRPTASTLLREV